MKKNSWLLLAVPLAMIGCNNANTKDSVEKADSANEAKTDSSSSKMDTTKTATMPVDDATSEFMVKVADDGMTEVNAGKLAQDKAKSQRVKDFAAMMVKDHSAAGDELKGLARQKNVTLPDSVSSDHRKMINDLTKKSGNDFDKSYMKMMEDAHGKAVNAFEKQSNQGKDADVKSWADKTLPTLRMHLDSAKAIHKAIK